MTLVIGSIHNQQITLVADTRVTYDQPVNEARTRRELLLRPTLKLMVVSPVLAVGFAGALAADLTGLYQAIYRTPDDIDATIAELAKRSAEFDEVFIAATLIPQPTLWRIREGHVVSTTKPGRLPIGDTDSYNLYLQQEGQAQRPDSITDDEPRSLQSIIQWFANVDNGPTERTQDNRDHLQAFTGKHDARFERTIGGFVTLVVSTPSGFRYEPITQQTLADRILYRPAKVKDGKLPLVGRRIKGDGHFQYTLGGGPPNRRAIGFCTPEAGTAVLYPDGQPWRWQEFTGLSSIEIFVERAGYEHGQMLLGYRKPTYIPMFFEPDIDFGRELAVVSIVFRCPGIVNQSEPIKCLLDFYALRNCPAWQYPFNLLFGDGRNGVEVSIVVQHCESFDFGDSSKE